MDRAADAILQAAGEQASLDEELSDVDLAEDRSSSLSDIEDKDPEQDDDAEGSDDLSNISDEENDSEAETERLEESPNKFRLQQDLVLSSHSNNQIYDRSPSKPHNQIIPDHQDDEDDDEPLSEDEMSIDESPESPKSSPHDDPEPPTAPTSLEDSSGDKKKMLSVIDTDTRKRKRSIMAGGAFDDDLGEPQRKRTGSVRTPADEYAIEDDNNQEEELDSSHPISGNISADEGGVAPEDDAPEKVEEPVADDENAAETPEVPVSPKKRGRKKKKSFENGIEIHEDETAIDGEVAVNGDEEVRNGEDENAENEGDDEAEAALKNEEEREFSSGPDC